MNSIIKYSILWFFMCFLSQPMMAQFPYVRTIEIDKSLQDIKVQTIIQDKKKLMWLGTNKGLYNYDGTDFKLKMSVVSTGELIEYSGYKEGTRSSFILNETIHK